MHGIMASFQIKHEMGDRLGSSAGKDMQASPNVGQGAKQQAERARKQTLCQTLYRHVLHCQASKQPLGVSGQCAWSRNLQ